MRSGAKQAVTAIGKALAADTNPRVRNAAAEMLGKIGPDAKEAVPAPAHESLDAILEGVGPSAPAAPVAPIAPVPEANVRVGTAGVFTIP